MISSVFRFHGHNSLRYVYKNGNAVRSQYITIKSVKNKRRSNSRVSVVVSKKVYKGAVGRNRIRRRVYEHIRTSLDKLNDTYDIVVIVTSPEIKDMSYPDLADLLDSLFSKSNLYK